MYCTNDLRKDRTITPPIYLPTSLRYCVDLTDLISKRYCYNVRQREEAGRKGQGGWRGGGRWRGGGNLLNPAHKCVAFLQKKIQPRKLTAKPPSRRFWRLWVLPMGRIKQFSYYFLFPRFLTRKVKEKKKNAP